MIDELDLVRRYMAEVDPASDLDAARRRLRQEIESETIREPARRGTGRSVAPRRRRVRVLILAAGVAAGVVAAVVLAAVPPPTKGHRAPLAAAAELRLIAANAAAQPIPALHGDQLLFTENRLALLAQAGPMGTTTPTTQATIDIDVKKWSNATGQSCVSITADPAQFRSPADQTTWSTLGLLDSPATQPVTDCGTGVASAGSAPDAITGDAAALDVSQLPVDPATLAQELENGTTGITALDQLTPDLAVQNVAFQRAAVLLIGPTTGATPAFESALYRALALIPGVTGTGNVTTHGGATGQGFTVDTPEGQSTVVLDPTDGALLEVQGINDSTSISSLAIEYLSPSGPSMVGNYGASILWLDPVGEPSVVGVASLPSTVPPEIFATPKPSATGDQVLALRQTLLRTFGYAGGSFLAPGAQPGSPGYVQWVFTGPGAEAKFEGYLKAAEASGLFSSIDVI